jgi:hypothetical protein
MYTYISIYKYICTSHLINILAKRDEKLFFETKKRGRPDASSIIDTYIEATIFQFKILSIKMNKKPYHKI